MQRALCNADGLSRQGSHVGFALVLCTDNRSGEAHSEPPAGHRAPPATYEVLRSFTHAGGDHYVAEGLRQLRAAELIDVTKTRLGSNVIRWTDKAIALQNAIARDGGSSSGNGGGSTSASARRRIPNLAGDASLAQLPQHGAEPAAARAHAMDLAHEACVPRGSGHESQQVGGGASTRRHAAASPDELAAALEHAAIVDPRDASADVDTSAASFGDAYRAIESAYRKQIGKRHKKDAVVRPARVEHRVEIGAKVLELARAHGLKLARAGEMVVAAYLARSNARLEREKHPLPWLLNDLPACIEAVRVDLNAIAMLRAERARDTERAQPTTIAAAPFEDGEGGIDLDALGFTKGRAA